MGAFGIDMMGQAADSAGGVVHGDLDGDVVFRDINWMLYDPDDPTGRDHRQRRPRHPRHRLHPRLPRPRPSATCTGRPRHRSSGPTTVKVCADAGDGTLVEQGDGYELYVEGGRSHLPVGWPGVGHGPLRRWLYRCHLRP